MEMIFNLGQGVWESAVGDKFYKTPQIELWGQITKPLAIRSKGKHAMFGIRFLTHSAAYFFNDEIGVFNDRVSDLSDVIGKSITTLHSQLLETKETSRRIDIVEHFLLNRLALSEKRAFRIGKVADILNCIKRNSSVSNINAVAFAHGITPRYLHKLIFQNTGLSPKSFDKINRFQLSLRLMAKNKPLTAVAYDCGYFDQSHFIRDFKSFTSVTPSAYLENNFPVNQLFLQ
jgi:AraC-like DNA-binding protein